MIEPTDLDWLALCLVTESNRPEEWPAIAQVVENRRRTGRWGDTYRGVVLAPKQFSAFNRAYPHDDALRFGLMLDHENPHLLMRAAAFCAGGPRLLVNGGRGFGWGITPETLHYWSPVSMKPPGSKPPWAAQAKRLYTPPGIDPERFVFAEGVP